LAGLDRHLGGLGEKGSALSKVLSLSCPCDRPDPVPAFQYEKPPEGETRFDWKGQRYQRGYRRCQSCGHWSAEIHMDLTDFYRGGYVDGTYGDRMRESLERILALPESESDNAGRVKRVLDFAKNRWKTDKVPDLLDVGSGLAVFPFRMREAGWQVTALDPDARAAEHARQNAKVHSVHADFLTWEPPEGSRFDVITLNKVLEHVENPVAMLERARRWIRPGGFVYVEVPDAAAVQAGSNREEFFIEHLHVFTLKSLFQAASKAGMMVEKGASSLEPSGKFTLWSIFEINPS